MVYLYEKKLPEINELVVVNVTEINDLNVITKLIDYNDFTGYLSFGELSKKKRVNINTIVSVGKNKTAIVTNINLDKNYVELSLRNISEEDIENFTSQHKKYNTLYNLTEQAIHSSISSVNYDVCREATIRYIKELICKRDEEIEKNELKMYD
jgi:translation initiation factor 2 alpha subunit (eIF-2alpha)